MHTKPLGRLVTVMAVIGGAMLAPSTVSADTDPPPLSPQAKAEAIANTAIVYLGVTWKGYLLPPGGQEWIGPYEASTSCTGFAVNLSGYVVTAGHCVDEKSGLYGGKQSLIESYVGEAVAAGRISTDDGAALIADPEAWAVEGKQDGAPIERSVTVVQPVAVSGLSGSSQMSANVVDYVPFTEGDVGLLKVQSETSLSALEVSASSPDVGTEIVSAGYPGSVTRSVDPKLSPSFKDGRISSHQTVEGIPFTEISAAMSGGMSGGPTVDFQGRAVGTNSFSPGGEEQAFNFITDTSTLRALLSRNGVTAEISAADRLYREGLTEYYDGNYGKAVEKFDATLEQQPSHAQAQAFKSKAVPLAAEEKDGGSSWPIYLGAAGGAALLLLLAGFLLVRRNRIALPPEPPAAPHDGSSPSGPDREEPAAEHDHNEHGV